MSKREKQYKTKSGYVLTEDVLEKIGEDCEKGIYPGESGRNSEEEKGNPFGVSSGSPWGLIGAHRRADYIGFVKDKLKGKAQKKI